MSVQKFDIASNLYIAFNNLSREAWVDTVRMFEKHRADIVLMPTDKYLHICYRYNEALFNTKDYYKLYKEIDALLYVALSEEIPIEVGMDCYEIALFWKAQSALAFMKYDQATYIMEELVKINPSEKLYQDFLFKSYYEHKPKHIYRIRAMAMNCFLLTVLIILLEILVIQSFYENYLPITNFLSYTLFALALGSLLLSELFFFAYCKWKVESLKRTPINR